MMGGHILLWCWCCVGGVSWARWAGDVGLEGDGRAGLPPQWPCTRGMTALLSLLPQHPLKNTDLPTLGAHTPASAGENAKDMSLKAFFVGRRATFLLARDNFLLTMPPQKTLTWHWSHTSSGCNLNKMWREGCFKLYYCSDSMHSEPSSCLSKVEDESAWLLSTTLMEFIALFHFYSFSPHRNIANKYYVINTTFICIFQQSVMGGAGAHTFPWLG